MALEDTIKPLVESDPRYVDILTNIIAVNSEAPDGWPFAAVRGWGGGHANMLLAEAVILSKGELLTLNCNPDDLSSILEPLQKSSPSPARPKPKTKEPTASDEDIQHFEQLVHSNKCMLKHWAPTINPKVEGLADVKEALLLSIISQGDEFGDRGRIHVLMHGDPGCAKSVLKDWIVAKLGAETCSQRTTSVGLTGDARGGEITPGALPRAHNTELQVLCIEEMDKFNDRDRQSMLEPMEEGICNIEAGGMSESFKTEVRLIGCANRINGFSPELLDRFDFKYFMTVPTGKQEQEVLHSIVMGWFGSKEAYDGILLRKYIHWIKDFKPGISLTDRAVISACMALYATMKEAPKSIRQKQAIIRVMYAMAKVNRRNIRVADFVDAVEMLNADMTGRSMDRLKKECGWRES